MIKTIVFFIFALSAFAIARPTDRTQSDSTKAVIKADSLAKVDSSNHHIPNSVTKMDFAFVSAIKSISGIRPSDEFFDINLRFLTPLPLIFVKPNLLVYAGFDMALTDTGSGQKKISEASLLLNLTNMNDRDAQRTAMGGILFKIFNGVPMAGVNFGGLELNESPFASSYVNVAYIWRLQGIIPQDQYIDSVRQSYQNIYVEFALHSDDSDAGILSLFRVKSGLLIPIFDGQATGITYRIAIEVPVGGIKKF